MRTWMLKLKPAKGLAPKMVHSFSNWDSNPRTFAC